MNPSLPAYHPQWIKEEFADFIFGLFSPLLSIKRPLAQVMHIRALPDNITEIVLKPNHHFKKSTFIPGQFVMIKVPVNGRFLQRCYSIIAIENGFIRLGIKKQGKVSQYIANKLKIGDVLEISQPQGEFKLTNQNKKRLFIAGGSGITAILPLLKQSLAQNHQPTTLIYFSRQPAYLGELTQLKSIYPQLNIALINSNQQSRAKVDKEWLYQICPDASERETYLCASSELRDQLYQLWEKSGWQNQLFEEQFFPVSMIQQSESQPVRFSLSHKNFMTTGTLLESAEQAGLHPSAGCRMGICNTCTCQKTRGLVKNLLTGEISENGRESIKLCISEALTAVEIAL